MTIKRYKRQDPDIKKEKQKYSSPIPSRTHILALMTDHEKPISHEDMQHALNVRGKSKAEALGYRLRAMVRDGQILKNRKGCYALVSQTDCLKGKVQAHRDGFGFLITEEKDYFIHPKNMAHAFDGDIVLAHAIESDRGQKPCAKIIKILEHTHTHLVGQLIIEGPTHSINAINRNISQPIIVDSNHQAKEHDYVLVAIDQYPTPRNLGRGHVEGLLGSELDSGHEVDVAIYSHDIPFVWPKELEQTFAKLPKTVSEAEKKDRLDWRNLPFVTIDGEDARDFDDAVFAKQTNSGWQLYVAIADVSHYVVEDSPLDQEAYKRSTSVYFPNRVIPMLPAELSNELCSLKPKVDRLGVGAIINIDPHGVIQQTEFARVVIQSHARLTYSEVAAMLTQQSLPPKWFEAPLNALHEVYQALEKQRELRQSLTFNRQETRIIYNKQGKIAAIKPTQSNVAHRLIEACMLAANVAVVTHLKAKKIPILYRNHDTPAEDKINDINESLKPLGLCLPTSKKIETKDLSKILKIAKKRHEQSFIEHLVLRTLPQAQYDPNNKGHFGLAYPDYTQFTSPIRRYPDLLIHRTLVASLTNKPYQSTRALTAMGQHCSFAERRAELASRDAIDRLKCHYMKQHLGQTYPGKIASITSFGLFVRLDELFVDGLVHVSELGDDYYHFDTTHHKLVGRHSGTSYALGDALTILVASVDMHQASINFALHQP
jgi:ribonuclease R